MMDPQELIELFEASIKLGMHPGLLMKFVSYAPKRSSGNLKKLKYHSPSRGIHQGGFLKSDLEEWKNFLWEPWVDPDAGEDAKQNARTPPTYIVNYLEIECGGLCARCNAPPPFETAHIEEWSKTFCHHPHNLIRLCTRCHDGYDKTKTIPKEEILDCKKQLIEKTVENLKSAISQGKIQITEWYKYRITGTIHRQDGGGVIKDALIRVVINHENIYESWSEKDGTFLIPVFDEVDSLDLVASVEDESVVLSASKNITWDDAINSSNYLILKGGREFAGALRWLGSNAPVQRADLSLSIPGFNERKTATDIDGIFKIFLPHDISIFDLNIQYDSTEQNIVINTDNLPRTIYLTETCKKPLYETFITQRICGSLDMEFVEIPDGKFQMGVGDNLVEVSLPGFLISRFPITCLQYSFFLQQNRDQNYPKNWLNRQPPEEKESHPITGLSWLEAQDFCVWLSNVTNSMCRLPTHAEWEKAARGMDDARVYPWGDDTTNILEYCNVTYSIKDTTPVNRYPLGKSPLGVWDMSGNVWEWTCTDENNKTWKTFIPGTTNPKTLIVKGGSFMDYPEEATCYASENFSPNKQWPQIGFRVAIELGGKNATINE